MKVNIYTNKGCSHGKNRYGVPLTPEEGFAFAYFCIQNNISMDIYTDEEKFDRVYRRYAKEVLHLEV
jgi:hypothetical protein